MCPFSKSTHPSGWAEATKEKHVRKEIRHLPTDFHCLIAVFSNSQLQMSIFLCVSIQMHNSWHLARRQLVIPALPRAYDIFNRVRFQNRWVFCCCCSQVLCKLEIISIPWPPWVSSSLAWLRFWFYPFPRFSLITFPSDITVYIIYFPDSISVCL